MFSPSRRVAGLFLACLSIGTITPLHAEQARLNAFLTLSAFDPEVALWARAETYAAHNLGVVHAGQTVELNLFLKHFGISNEGQSKVSYSIEMTDPQGTLVQRGENLSALDQPMNATRTFLTANEVAILEFPQAYAAGTYQIRALVTDHVKDETITVGAFVKLERLDAVAGFASEAEYESWLTHYYLDPMPGRALKAFLENAAPMQDPALRSWAQIIFYYEIFAANDWLQTQLIADFDSLTELQRANAVFLLGLLKYRDPAFFAALDSDLAELYHDARNLRLPDPTDAIHSPEALEMHWFRFFASGEIRSLQPIAQLLEYAAYEGTLREVADIAESLTDAQREAALKDVLFQSARWSLAGNCIEHPAVHRFCTYLAETGQLSEDAEAVMVDLLRSVRQELAADAVVSESQGG
ncbi:MAG: hypothetical protein ACFBZ8_02820 [Opitutales bacterium]